LRLSGVAEREAVQQAGELEHPLDGPAPRDHGELAEMLFT
jgi:hypothetical protein